MPKQTRASPRSQKKNVFGFLFKKAYRADQREQYDSHQFYEQCITYELEKVGF